MQPELRQKNLCKIFPLFDKRGINLEGGVRRFENIRNNLVGKNANKVMWSRYFPNTENTIHNFLEILEPAFIKDSCTS